MKMTKKLRLVLLLGMFIVIGVGLYNTFTKRAAIKGAEVDTYVDVDKKVVLMKGEEFIPAEGYTLEDIRGVVDTERVGKYDIFYCKGWILQKQQVWVTNIGWSDDYYISLNGEETIYLDKGDAFKDPGATIYQMKDYSNLDNNVRRDDWSKEIVVEGEVDVNIPGCYEIEYHTPHGYYATRTVCVSGKKEYCPPIEPRVVLIKGEEFIPAKGYTFEDIQGFVDTEKVGLYQIMYAIGPVVHGQNVWVTNIKETDEYYIELNGEKTICLEKGRAFKDPGATIFQRKEGNDIAREDWSEEIVVEGEVDVNTSGSYEIKYCTPYGQWARRTVIVYNERRRVTSKTSNEKPLPPINYSEDPIETEYNRHDLDSTGNKDEYPNSNSNDDEDNHLGANLSKSEETGRDY